jgi:hypothetical protein
MTIAAAIAAGALGACSSANNAPGGTSPGPNTYISNGLISLPGVPPTVGTFSFDIGFVDPVAGQYYLADRTNAGVDVINTTTLQYVSTAGAKLFTGNVASPPNTAGPNGVLSIGGGTLFAGDGNSTLKVLNATSGSLLATVPTVNPYHGPPLPATCGGAGTPTTGLGNARVDEMAYDPTDNIVLAINDAACPPFGTFFNANPPYNIIGTVAFTTANAGVEQPTWDPTQKKFIVAVPSTLANAGGEIDLIDPKSFAITNVFPVTGCNPNGDALGQNETLFLGCNNVTGPLLTINAATGAVLNSIPNTGGADEASYSSASNRFFAASSNNAGGPILVIADGNGNLIQTIATSAGAHSVAVDSHDRAYVPQRALGVTTFGH